MVTTSDDELAERMNQLRNHGASISEEQRHQGARPYLLPEFNLLGYNYRMTDLQGAVGRVQLAKLDAFIDERARWARLVPRAAGQYSLAAPACCARRGPARMAVVRHLRRSGDGAQVAQRDHGGPAGAGNRDPAGHACGAHAGLLPRPLRPAPG